MSRKTNWADTISAFAIGIGVGAALGVLLAPKSGEDTRDYLAQNARQGVDQAVSKGREWAERAQRTVDDATERVQNAVDAGTQAYRQAANSPS